MRLITSTGYFGSGSSAVTDLMLEYDCVASNRIGAFEVNFFHGYDGVNKLYKMIVDWRKYQDIAIHEFLHSAKRVATNGAKMNYEKYFNHKFMEYTQKYVEELRGEKLGVGDSAYDFRKMTVNQMLIYRIINKLYYLLFDLPYNMTHTDVREKRVPIFVRREQDYSYDISEEEFITITKKYLYSLYNEISDGKDILYIDGIFQGKYFDDVDIFYDDLRVTLVDRDPRDMYLSSKYIWKSFLPHDPKQFCLYYKNVHKGHKMKTANVMKLQFEDLVFDYENTVSKVESFFGVDSSSHSRLKQNFNPEKSRNNCQLWKKYPDEIENMKIIGDELADYIVTKYD